MQPYHTEIHSVAQCDNQTGLLLACRAANQLEKPFGSWEKCPQIGFNMSKTASETPTFAADEDENSDNARDDLESADSEVERRNVKTFTRDSLSDLILKRFVEEGFIALEDTEQRNQMQKTLVELFDESAPEIGAVEKIQKYLHALPIEEPGIKYKESGLKYEDYLRQNFNRSIRRGYLPVTEIDDPELRRRISVEKSRQRFPADLKNVCLTQHETADELRSAMRVVSLLKSKASKQFSSFVRTLVPTPFR